MQEYTLDISSYNVRVNAVSVGNGEPTILFLHANSACWRMFKHFWADQSLTSSHRLISFDLPGHGKSEDAVDPERTYNIGAYTEIAVEVLVQLKVASVIVFGASLGGQIAMELLGYLATEPAGKNLGIEVKGVMTCGSPACQTAEEVAESFNLDPDPAKNVVAAETLTDDMVEMIVTAGYGSPREPWMEEAARRTDGRARAEMVKAFLAGKGRDQRKIVRENTVVPLAVTNGANDALVRTDTLQSLAYGKLWRGKCVLFDGLGHAPFWEGPDEFMPVFREFVDDCSK